MEKNVEMVSTMPPLLVVGTPHSQKNNVPNIVRQVVIKTNNSGENAPASAKSSSLSFLQTSDGKKILLTNLVNSNQSPSGVKQNKFVILPNAHFSSVNSSNTLSVSGVATPNAQINNDSVIIKTSMASTSGVLRSTSQNQTLCQKKSCTVSFAKSSTVGSPKKLENTIGTSAPVSLMKPTQLLKNPVIYTSDNDIFINNGPSRFKVVGKPFPVTLGKVPLGPSEVGQNVMLKSPVNIAPKVNHLSIRLTDNESQGPFENIHSVRSEIKRELPSPSEVSKPFDESSPAAMIAECSASPSYVNVKVENQDPEDIKSVVMESDSTSTVEEIIKDDPDDDKGALHLNHSKLNKPSPQQRKFYMRSADGSLISITSEAAEAIGLNSKDEYRINQRRVSEAFKPSAQEVDGKLKELASTAVIEPTVLIPENVNLVDFVNCNVPQNVRLVASFMKNIKKIQGLRDTKTFDGFGNMKKMENPNQSAIVGEFVIDEKPFLRIQIEQEQEKKFCDIPITSDPINLEQQYRCPFCCKNFKSKDHIISHIRVHTGERPYPCEICGKKYRQRVDIVRHMRIHTGEKPFTCCICNATFNQKSNLRSHMRIHTGERPRECKVCGKAFSRNSHLKQHLKLHTGEKPFNCEICSRAFRFKSGLQAHKRIHSGSKPYACGICGRSFTQIVGLTRHERTHSEERPFRCLQCGKSFDNQKTLYTHCQKHLDKRPHKCIKCKKSFVLASELRSHIKKYHNRIITCYVCHKDDFNSLIELREHHREHERNQCENSKEDTMPSLLPPVDHYVSVSDVKSEEIDSLLEAGSDVVNDIESKMNEDERDAEHVERRKNEDESEAGNNSEKGKLIFKDFSLYDSIPAGIKVEVELDADDPLNCDDEGDSENEEDELYFECVDPLAC